MKNAILRFVPNVDKIAVANYVVLPLETHLSRGIRRIERARGLVVFVVNDLGADESLGDVVMDRRRRLESRRTLAQRPCSRVVLSRSKEGDETKGVVHSPNNLRGRRFAESERL